MLVKKIKFTDFDGNEREMEYYFHLTTSEVAEWLLASGDYTLDKVLVRIGQTNNTRELFDFYKDIVHRSYGIKSLDGISFEKTEEAWNKFYHSEAYSQLFMELVADADKFLDFINGIVPKDLSEEIDKYFAENKDSLPDLSEKVTSINQ